MDPRGEWLVQSLRQDFLRGLLSVDGYSRATEYTGLSLVFLNWATPHLPRRMLRVPIPADSPMQAVVGQQNGRFAVVSRGDLWYAVRMRPGSLRYDFGLVALKRRQAGVWRDIAPLRPYANGTAGPIRLGDGQQRPVGERLSVDAAGTVSVTGGFAAGSAGLGAASCSGWLPRAAASRSRHRPSPATEWSSRPSSAAT